MVVMLVYGKAEDVLMLPTVVSTSPVTLILHGTDGQTWLSMAEGPCQKSDVGLVNAIEQAFEVKTSESNAP